VLRRSKRIRRSLPLWQRMLAPGEHSVFLGRAHWRHRLCVPLEEHMLVMAPPRTYKTAFLADVILRYPGPVIATTTKADVYALTAAVRARRGPVHVFNPQYIGRVPSTFCWSPVEGCEDPATAVRRADAFAFAVSQKGVEDGTFWSAKASDYLRGYFHAAALAGYDMRAVAAWVSGADPHVPERILVMAGAKQWALTLAELRSEAQKTTATVRMVMSRALAFMADPALAASVLPAPGGGFDIRAFLDRAGTVYMIAESTTEDAPVAPLFAAMATEIHHTAALTGQASASGRLDPPLLMAWTRSPRSARSRCPPGCRTPAARASRSSPSYTARRSWPAAGRTTAARWCWTPPRSRCSCPASPTPPPCRRPAPYAGRRRGRSAARTTPNATTSPPRT
jgi:hypothetical protein